MRKVVIAATSTIGIVLALALWYWAETTRLILAYDSLFKLVGLAIGPLLAVLGFFWGLLDKAELKDLAEELGKAREKAERERQSADAARLEVTNKVEQIRRLEHDLETIADAGRLWKLRPNAPFAEYTGWKFDPQGAKIVTIGLFKGGVGKSHLAANFAAYVSEKQKQNVLVIDLDYQGSLSTVLLLAAGADAPGSNIDALLDEAADLTTVTAKQVHLAAHGPGTTLNSGNGLSRAWLVPADYTLAQVESRLLIERVIHQSMGLDERYRLAHVLLHPAVRRNFGIIIIDTPPRMTLGTVNALIASHELIVPIILDRVSSEAFQPFLRQIETLVADLDLDLRLAGVVASMTRQMTLSPAESAIRAQIAEIAKAGTGSNTDKLIDRNLPRKVQITDGDDLGYFLNDNQGSLRERLYDPIFDELWGRIHAPRSGREFVVRK